MKTKAVRLYGADTLRLEEFELPPIKDNEVLLKVISDSLCASTYKAVKQGSAHKRVPNNISTNPIIIGHEMCGEIIEVGNQIKDKWQIGQKVVIQPALKLPSGYDPGYSYEYIGGAATYVIVPSIVLEKNCMISYSGDSFFKGSLVEPLGCIIRGFKGFYHTDYTTYERFDGAKRNGKIAILGGAGPMGIGAIDMAIGYAGVNEIVVTDLSQERLDYAASKVSVSYAKEKGVKLTYLNTSKLEDVNKALIDISNGGFDDVFVMVPVPSLFSMAEAIAKEDGCINFFAGPSIHNLPGSINLYRVHYDGIHVVGTAGSIPSDTSDVINLIEENKINPGVLVSHILGLKDYAKVILEMSNNTGAKKLCYTHLDIPYIDISHLSDYKDLDPMYGELDKIIKANNGLWNKEAESYLLEHAKKI